jgi:AcrR family transcriptional regulator
VTRVAESSSRISRRQVDKFAARRAQLANSALQTLSELGYARTSLREIAQNSDFSHGVLHYYFHDKVDLITEGVRQYKAECVTHYDEIVANSRTADELRHGFGEGMAATLSEDASMHRLWYDMRTQSFFEESFRADVLEIDQSLEQMIWRIVSRFSALAERPLTVSSSVAYAIFDGLFQQSLLKHLSGDQSAAAELRANVEHVLAGLLQRD